MHLSIKMKTDETETSREAVSTEGGQWLEVVRKQVASLSFGVVQITVHDSKVVQIEKTEKIRFQQPKSAPSGIRRENEV